ncbi:MAG TPA: HEXXH motif-containing putative peptide modification protein [Actinocrinis sp.]|uniref:aKG-HExxH-type peptide beta-hydroxylase n=1 Tax=Actinocrinis sp. TaxID=1920516 RepID=UPI002DDDB293|nr:HEXXH motif-containing putative peptide modification protein [Actinocrinis sp.]HEV2346999.1 HEXXH motif-containing putative peptide modification protein [Actinocrinis sp.]
MDTLDLIAFATHDVDRWREARLDKLHQVLRKPSTQSTNAAGISGTALEFAIAHHLLEGAERAARAGKADTLAWYRSRSSHDFDDLRTASEHPYHLAPAIDPKQLDESGISDAPFYLLGPDSEPASHDLLHLVDSALSAADETGFGALVRHHAAIICLLRRRPLGTTMASWSITRLPGTVFTDHADEPLVLTRDLIHEAGHNWLNSVLSARGVEISDSPLFYSPWKQQSRSPFGFLHACWAFPLTMIFTATILESAIGRVATFLSAYLDQQRSLLAGTDREHSMAQELIYDPELRETLAAVHQAARSL